MTTPQTESGTPLAPVAWSVLLLLAGTGLAVHLALYNRFGFHLDELYFLECARQLAFGYVDHPPLVPWIAAVGMKLFGENLFAIRFFPALASGATILLTGLMAREMGARRYAQGLAALAALLTPAYLRSGGLLCITIFELLFWAGLSYSLIRVLNTQDRRWWLAAGVAAGLGLLTKNTMAVWGGALAVGMLLTPARRLLLSPWPWLGAALAVGMFTPNVLWQIAHGWPTLEFLRNLRAELVQHQSRVNFLFQQLIIMFPLLAPIWGAGLWFLFSRSGKRFRMLGWAFVFTLLFFLIGPGKHYYLSPAYTVLFAAGAVQLEHMLSLRPRAPLLRRALVTVVLAGGTVNALFALPIIPLETSDRVIGIVFGKLVDPRELTREFHAQYGWESFSEDVRGVYEALPEAEKPLCAILCERYWQAAAINFFGKPHGVPRAASGHMNYYLWGLEPGRGKIAIACGFPPEVLASLYADVREVSHTFHPLSRQGYTDFPIYVCRDPKVELTDVWYRFKRYYHAVQAQAAN